MLTSAQRHVLLERNAVVSSETAFVIRNSRHLGDDHSSNILQAACSARRGGVFIWGFGSADSSSATSHTALPSADFSLPPLFDPSMMSRSTIQPASTSSVVWGDSSVTWNKLHVKSVKRFVDVSWISGITYRYSKISAVNLQFQNA